ncbi:MAG: biotin--[acetyl-CoA-carboxylase] ligase [Acetobacteraceae bacterium]
MPQRRLELHDSLPSTNDRAIALAGGGAPPWTAVVAREQTAGRGRHGRAWIGGHGNLFLSVLLDCRLIERPSAWSLIAAIATAETVEAALTSPAAVSLKWPNDVLVDGGKIAGILIEAGSGGAHGAWAVAGIGINLASAPREAGLSAVSLADLGVEPPDPEPLARVLVERLAHWGEAAAREGYGRIVSAWQSRAAAAGSTVTVRLPDGPVHGRYLGLDEDGALLVRLDGGLTRRIVTGEIVARG